MYCNVKLAYIGCLFYLATVDCRFLLTTVHPRGGMLVGNYVSYLSGKIHKGMADHSYVPLYGVTFISSLSTAALWRR
jgi:hypothetical protein